MISVASGCLCDRCKKRDASVYDTHARLWLCQNCIGKHSRPKVLLANIVPEYSRRSEYKKRVAKSAAERQAAANEPRSTKPAN